MSIAPHGSLAAGRSLIDPGLTGKQVVQEQALEQSEAYLCGDYSTGEVLKQGRGDSPSVNYVNRWGFPLPKFTQPMIVSD